MIIKKRHSKAHAPAAVCFGSSKSDRGKGRQLCLWAKCSYSGKTTGPVWGHSDASVRRALATLSSDCECGRRFHTALEFTGHRVCRHTGT